MVYSKVNRRISCYEALQESLHIKKDNRIGWYGVFFIDLIKPAREARISDIDIFLVLLGHTSSKVLKAERM